MFIRRTKTRSPKAKVDWCRDGSEFAVATEHWAVLCSRIEQLLERQGVLVELDPEEVEREAQRIALQLVQRLR